MRRFRQAQLAITLTTIVCLTIPCVLTGQSRQKTASFKELAEMAKTASDENRLQEAAALYARALALRPRWKEGWWSLGNLEYDQDHYPKAARHFEKLIALDPANGTAHAMLGLCQFELHNDQLALKNLLKAEQLGVIKNDQLRNVALYHLALLQLRFARFGAAREAFGQLVRDRFQTRDISDGLGLAALLIPSKDAPAEGTPGAQVVSQVGHAEALLFSNQFDAANEIYQRLVADFPQYPGLHFAYGRFLVDLNELDRAAVQLKEELLINPNHVITLLELAATRAGENPAEAAEYAKKAVELDPRLPIGHYLLGQFYADAGNPQAALPELEIAKRLLPQEPKVYFALGKAYSQLGRKEDAAKARSEFRRLQKFQDAKRSQPGVYDQQPLSLPDLPK